MKKITALAQLKQELARIDNRQLAFVPTMGALHAGHLSLVDLAAKHATTTLVTIFVNPKQFAPHEDFAAYPRPLAADLQKLAARDVDLVFVPSPEEIYPPGFQTWVVNDILAHDLCGKSRPQHFRGVLTVVLKLLLLIRPRLLVLGKKDYQQMELVKRMATDFHLETEIIGAETQRDPDGLALSSRNAYLNPHQRRVASTLRRALQEAKQLYHTGEKNPLAIQRKCRAVLEQETETKIDYLELRSRPGLTAITSTIDADWVLLLAVYIGNTRLIDNIES